MDVQDAETPRGARHTDLEGGKEGGKEKGGREGRGKRAGPGMRREGEAGEIRANAGQGGRIIFN